MYKTKEVERKNGSKYVLDADEDDDNEDKIIFILCKMQVIIDQNINKI
jgi:hypothetical protein